MDTKNEDKIKGGKKVLGIVLAILAVLGLLAPLGLAVYGWQDNNTAKAVTILYRYDPVNEQWVKSETEEKVPDNPDGTRPRNSNTLIIRIGENEPVKQIIIFEALVIHGANEPLLEINGHDTSGIGGTGKLRIGELKFAKVDAERLEIKDTDVVRVQMANVVADDNELDIDVDVVNVVRVGRGAASTLIIGATRKDLSELAELEALSDTDGKHIILPRETGVRVDRIRILGPDSNFGSIERLVITRSSVFGKIEVKNVEIQDLILRDVTLDET
ncbi:MAG: hypothetical protein HYX79_04090 [Chloroflexi bacterium]|nr:hypothetical protein [Chloroflexota bacterium]